MLSFSQRKGLKPVRKVMQVDSMDEDLRSGLWNAYFNTYLSEFKDHELHVLHKRIWHGYFKKPVDQLWGIRSTDTGTVRSYFFRCDWNEVYDFIEFIVSATGDEATPKFFIRACNSVLEREQSAYRFVGGKIVQMTAKEEIAEIEKALQISDSLKPVRTHLNSALDHLSNRKSPDYRNSIKESISAVEAICKLITGDDGGGLKQALKVIKDKVGLHAALEKGFNSIYGYTSAAEGIRHALLKESTDLSFEDAKFMLVACSAFVNYLIAKASRANIAL